MSFEKNDVISPEKNDVIPPNENDVIQEPEQIPPNDDVNIKNRPRGGNKKSKAKMRNCKRTCKRKQRGKKATKKRLYKIYSSNGKSNFK